MSWCGNYCIAQFESKRKQYPQCLYEKRLFIYLPKMCGGISLIGLFMVTAGLAAVYGNYNIWSEFIYAK
jgi:hypothetical protein